MLNQNLLLKCVISNLQGKQNISLKYLISNLQGMLVNQCVYISTLDKYLSYIYARV